MLLIIEIILTFFAWRKGWRWIALLPVGICITIGFFIGLTGGNLDGGVVFVPDIIATLVLILMIVKGTKSNDPTKTK